MSDSALPAELEPHRQAIAAYKAPRDGWRQDLAGTLESPLEQFSGLMAGTSLGEGFAVLVNSALGVLNDLSIWSIPRDSLYQYFQNAGHDVHGPDDIRALSLDEIESVLGMLKLKYKLFGLVEGATLGSMGWAGSVASVAALTTLALRSINEYATYYGFDITEQPQERDYALSVLAIGVAATRAARQDMLRQVSDMNLRLARRQDAQAASGAGKEAAHSIIVEPGALAEALVVRLVKGELVQVPILGSALSISHNHLFLDEVCEGAHRLYAERAMLRRYGPEAAVPVPAEG